MDSSDKTDLVSLYKEASELLDSASSECEKAANVDLTAMIENTKKCLATLQKVEVLEDHHFRKACLQQLCLSLGSHQELLIGKLKQLDTEGDQPLPEQQDDKRQETSANQDLPNNSYTKTNDGAFHTRQSAIVDTIVPKGQLRFEDVAGLTEAKQALTEAIIMPLQYPQLFTGARKPWRRILLYGPPGTGKSRLAQAVSSEIDSTFYCVSSSDLVSSWVGESEKLIKGLFQHAQSQAGRSVIFIDEIDSICRKRSSQEEEHTRRIKTELLKQMEGADNARQAEKIFLLCATNCPWELDSAFLRRFQKRIYIPLPDREARTSLIKIHTRGSLLQLSEEDWRHLAERTEGYSGSDISTMILGALFEPVRDMQNAQFWKHGEEGKLIPCDSEEPGEDTIKAQLLDLPPEKVQPREIVIGDFYKSLTSHRNTVSTEDLEKFQQFTKKFGQNG